MTVATRLAAVAVPVVSLLPNTFVPVDVTVNTLAMPPTEVDTFEFANTWTFELPLPMLVTTGDANCRLPSPLVVRTWPFEPPKIRTLVA